MHPHTLRLLSEDLECVLDWMGGDDVTQEEIKVVLEQAELV